MVDDVTIASAHRATIPEEVGSMLRAMREQYIEGVTFARTHLERTLEQADADLRTRRMETEYGDTLDSVYAAGADQVSWGTLSRMLEHTPQEYDAAWGFVLEEARHELDSGHRAAGAVDWMPGTPYDRARFLAVRQAFRDAWQPRGGIEDALIDTMAEAHSEHFSWMSLLHSRTMLDVDRAGRRGLQSHDWEPPKLTEAEAVDQAMQMVERWNKLFVRTLRSLQNLRRYPLVVNAGQLNVANQQVNMTGTSGAAGAVPVEAGAPGQPLVQAFTALSAPALSDFIPASEEDALPPTAQRRHEPCHAPGQTEL